MPPYSLHTRYILSVLAIALQDQTYTLQAAKSQAITGSRNMRFLESGYYDVNWMHTNQEREEKLCPVRVPIFRGLAGWRVMQIATERKAEFNSPLTLQDLKKLNAGLGYDWPDTQVFKHNKLPVVTATGHKNLLTMIQRQRIDYLPRGVLEAWLELESPGQALHSSLFIEKTLLVRYPTAYYFFVRQEDKALAQRMSDNLIKATEDGSFQENFYFHYSELLAKAELQHRQIVDIDNPFLPEQTPLQNIALWFNISEIVREKKEID